MLGCHDLLGERRIRSNHDEGCAVQGVRASGEHSEGLSSLVLSRLNLEAHLSTLRTTNPVALHEQNTVGPLALQLLHVIQQLLRVISDLEVPLVQRLLSHGSTAHAPLTTCSFASTVWSLGHQLTMESLRYARPFL